MQNSGTYNELAATPEKNSGPSEVRSLFCDSLLQQIKSSTTRAIEQRNPQPETHMTAGISKQAA